MQRIAKWNIQDRNKLEAEAADTADLILFLDSLFDCLNSSSKVAPKSKLLKGGITENSPHEEFLKKSFRRSSLHEVFAQRSSTLFRHHL
ncbi:hypothetical protein NQ317_012860 [Molorchus minor]|uniref:Uncharacterized protein n=1 Tax=Molorchus minor TaxID=1323400 RepID=A0ABQ9IZG0_9CUCU|nr:hypothetical protein NQ317_012860 [Molorchus minor]